VAPAPTLPRLGKYSSSTGRSGSRRRMGKAKRAHL
jgi:hypothetical protein